MGGPVDVEPAQDVLAIRLVASIINVLMLMAILFAMRLVDLFGISLRVMLKR